MRFKLISCEIFYREMCACIARSPHQIDVDFLPKGLHDIGQEKMLAELKAALAKVEEEKYDAILLGYGLCNNGIVGLEAKTIPLVVARAHDCITLFMGSKERYQKYFESNPGTYYLTSGWIERGNYRACIDINAMQTIHGMKMSFQDLVEKYGEENAKYLSEQFAKLTQNYNQFTFIEMGIEPNGQFEKTAKEEAGKKGWQFAKIEGHMGLFQRLLNGEWNEEDFLIVPPGNKIAPSFDHGIISKEETK